MANDPATIDQADALGICLKSAEYSHKIGPEDHAETPEEAGEIEEERADG